MKYDVEFSREALASLIRLDKKIAQRIRNRWKRSLVGSKQSEVRRKLRYKGTERNQLWMEVAVAEYDLLRIAKLALIEEAH